MNKYFEKKINDAVLHGISNGEFVLSPFVLSPAENKISLIVSLPRSERKDTSVSFTAFVFDVVKYDENTIIESGFYPVRYQSKIQFGFYNAEREMVYIIASAYAHHVRYGKLLDLDRSRFESEVLKHLNHEAAENRKLQKEVKALREELSGKASEKKSEGLKYEAPKQSKPETVADIMSSLKDEDEDDDDLYI